MTTKAERDEDYEAQVELARLLRIYIRKRQRAHLPRYKTGGRAMGRIAMYQPASRPDYVLFSVSLDLLEKWYGWNFYRLEPARLPPNEPQQVSVSRFRQKNLPAAVMRLVEFIPPGKRVGAAIRPVKSRWTWTAAVRREDLGFRPYPHTPSIRRVEIVDWPALHGTVMIFPPSYSINPRPVANAREILDAEIDPLEPPRFRHNTPHPGYKRLERTGP